MERIKSYFTIGTESTQTGGCVGIEIETQFLDELLRPMSADQTLMMLEGNAQKPDYCDLKLELGCHNLELNIQPQKNFDILWPRVQESLAWLYVLCGSRGFYPAFEPAPLVDFEGDLILVADDRDKLWIDLDGRKALEWLCRCSSVQFTIDVHPDDAVPLINLLWQKNVHQYDYNVNDLLWRRYIADSRFGYRTDRYGGPRGFENLDDYVRCLSLNEVVMHQGKPCRKMVKEIDDLDINLFLRSIWWHYRLRRYRDALAIEIRPFSRRSDDDILTKWRYLSNVLGL